MGNHDIVVIGASAGGLEALQELVRALPRAIPASIFAVVHLPYWAESNLARILSRNGSLPARQAQNGELIQRGHIYVAPADHHLILENNRTVVVHGPKENRSRPAIDPLFRSAAIAYGTRVIGVLLSGNLDDGSSGMWQIKHRGGLTVIQDPRQTRFPGMVENALASVQIDHVVALEKMAPLLLRLIKTDTPRPGPTRTSASKHMLIEQKIAKMEDNAQDIYKLGKPSSYVCPECSGTLFEIREGKMERYRCRTGHAYTEGSLIAEQATATEDALWTAMRALREQADLMKGRAGEHPGNSALRKRFNELSKQAEEQAIQVRNIIEKNGKALAGLRDNTEAPGPNGPKIKR